MKNRRTALIVVAVGLAAVSTAYLVLRGLSGPSVNEKSGWGGFMVIVILIVAAASARKKNRNN